MVAVTKFLWLALTATAAIASPIIRRDPITVQNDINQKIGPSWNTLNNDINGFPNSGLTGVIAIQQDFINVVASLNGATSDIKSTGSFGTVGGTTILASIQVQVPTYLATLVNLGAQAPSWSAIPGGQALVLSDLQTTNTAMSNFLDAIIAAQPLLLKAGALAIKAQVSGAFTTAIGYYSVL